MSNIGVNNAKTRPNINKRNSFNTKKKKRKKTSITLNDADNFDSKSRHYVSPIDKQVLFQDVIKQFAEWPPWQKRLLLCRVTEKTSSTLLSTLATVLEPIFHRDFEVKSKCGFDSSLIKTFMDQRNSTASLLRGASAVSVHSLSPIVEPSSDQSSLSTSSVMINRRGSIVSLLNANKALDRPVSPSPSRPVSPSPSRPVSPCESVTSRCVSPRQLTSYSPPNSSRNIPSRFLKVSRKESRRRSTLKDIDLLSMSSLADGLNSMLVDRGAVHTHEVDRDSNSLSTMEFLLSAHKQKMSKLGVLVKPSTTHLNGISSVRQYKHHKWWLPPIDNSLVLKRVSKKSLLKSFKTITEEFVCKYMSWSNAEKGDFLLHIVDYCQPDEIKFLANCIYQRIENVEDINNINDAVLLNIFSYLQIDDLARAAQVCKRWKYFTSSGRIWEKKCFDLAYEHDQLDVMNNLQISSMELDWKQLYNELKESIAFLESIEAQIDIPLPSPSVVSKQNASEHNFCFLNESQNLEDIQKEDIVNKESVPTLIENKVSGALDETVSFESKCGIEDQLKLAMEQNESMLKVMLGSIDKMGEDYATEEELRNKLEETPHEEKDNEDKDVAFDVRVRLVQAANQIVNKGVTEEPDADDDDYQLMQISNIKTVNRVRKLEGHVDAVLCLQFDSKRVVTGSSDRSVRLWDIRSGRCFRSLVGHQGGVRCLKFDDKYIITGSWDTTVIVWDVVNFELICTLVEHTNCVSCIEMTSNFLITASHDTTVCIFEKDSWLLLTRLVQHTAPISCMCLLSPSELLTGSHDKTILLWDLDTYSVLRKFQGMKHSCLCVKVCGSLIAAGASDGTITFWDMSTSSIEGCIVAHNAPVNALCFVESRFFSAGENVIKEWDLSTCTCLRSLRGHTGPVLCLRASSKRVVSGSADGTTRIWDMASKLQQVGRNYDELNKNIIPTQVLNEHQFKEITLAK